MLFSCDSEGSVYIHHRMYEILFHNLYAQVICNNYTIIFIASNDGIVQLKFVEDAITSLLNRLDSHKPYTFCNHFIECRAPVCDKSPLWCSVCVHIVYIFAINYFSSKNCHQL